ncbi:MAG: glycerol-3-phosphate dehydrogenase [Candidatus Marinimicrobia bacterium]|nr:glycerol-3-phosphate dehydrogenase [Candidatus Neomarinimicrobiota bacterium]
MIALLGAGSWGGTVAEHLAKKGLDVSVWHRNRDELSEMMEKRSHPFLENLQFSSSVNFLKELDYFEQPDIVVIGVPSHGVRELSASIPESFKGAIFVNLAKGIENESLLRMSEVISQCGQIDPSRIVTISGPSHAEEVVRGLPTTLVAAGINPDTCKTVQRLFSREALRVYVNEDIIGVELGGSIKNVIALAAGVCDGIGFGDNTKAALITRGIVEISRLGNALGGKSETFTGLSGMGDLIATCLSKHSRNRYVGEQIGQGRALDSILTEMTMVAEGVKTASSVQALAEKHSVEMPICDAVYSVLNERLDPKAAVSRLMSRDLGSEQ